MDHMEDSDKPIIDMTTLRRDLYFVMCLLLADKEVAKIEKVVDWSSVFYESEVCRLMLWIATAVRGLLELKGKNDGIKDSVCGEYWPDFPNPEDLRPLTIRQACNSVIHSTTILTYKIPKRESNRTVTQVYKNRLTIKSTHRGKPTHAELDIIKFVQIADSLIDSF